MLIREYFREFSLQCIIRAGIATIGGSFFSEFYAGVSQFNISFLSCSVLYPCDRNASGQVVQVAPTCQVWSSQLSALLARLLPQSTGPLQLHRVQWKIEVHQRGARNTNGGRRIHEAGTLELQKKRRVYQLSVRDGPLLFWNGRIRNYLG